MPQGIAELIRVNGERARFDRPLSLLEVRRLIQAETLDTINLKDGHVMLVDDTGKIDKKPPNVAATFIYQRVRNSLNKIHGDVVIAWDEDYA
jgi:hypothetical protein